MSRQITKITESILLIFGLTICQHAYSQSKTISITDGRPVAKAAEMLESIYDVPITYEGPIAVNDSQLQDVTEQVQRTPDRFHRVIVQKDVTLSFTYQPPTSGTSSEEASLQTHAATKAEVEDALKNVLDAYAAAGGRVTFTVTHGNGIFHIIPANFLNKEGKLQKMTPILDARITIPPGQRTAAGLLNDICQALATATGISVYPNYPINFFAQHATAIFGSDVTARSLLSQLLDEMAAPVSREVAFPDQNGQRVPRNMVVYKGGPLSWQLFYGPGWGYALNIHKLTVANK